MGAEIEPKPLPHELTSDINQTEGTEVKSAALTLPERIAISRSRPIQGSANPPRDGEKAKQNFGADVGGDSYSCIKLPTLRAPRTPFVIGSESNTRTMRNSSGRIKRSKRAPLIGEI